MTTDTISPAIDPTGFVSDWEDWHAAHETQRAAADGFLAITGLHFLTTEPERFGDAPGAWSVDEVGPVVELAADEQLSLDGVELTGRHSFGAIAERDGVNARAGDAVIEIARRGGELIVRPRHPDTQFRAAYSGTPTYLPNPGWRVEARFLPFDPPRDVTVGAAVEGLQHVYSAPGELEFAHDGAPYHLTAFSGHAPGSLLVVFTDATSGLTTYAANRALTVAAPDAEGRTTLDFTRAVNLPCAYTDYATCPLPPAENRIPFAVEAGEKIPVARVAVTL
ncbi:MULTISPECIES: DUF1684 domain-containing protein [Cryobacterium]|uniref:DUF1684 domain-containing protein n=1 Tax=Cryobacterium glucosi TaxID=1259175 RepID=A0ABY2IR48_9MICO|nr:MULTISPECIES: DUF1684 domain-containing protein [Cryobacterium]TFB98830.1 DUF1684 domain-containing protein [Cryobacterium sp. MDB2-A-1]TFC04254.1 DUF1684 domain-containing protein [Cryobacterium sp. MDB2-33-2]TFC14919.1 DUF1684 domain-containing protein [Cryobacterium sp. MDB2-A-2]TFC16427.1 DUF1684 domain-containing protein [Cryobacterium sp. MDB2-10]TFC21152.1 DUF1684 domain-containing protein [Cryobacterium glucosi]